MARRAWRYRLARRLFGGPAVDEAVSTRLAVRACPDAVWRNLVLYEEVPGPAPWLLRCLLPVPILSQGAKSARGDLVRCRYREGELWKRITVAEAPVRLEFEVVEQRLGIEACILARGGSFRLRPAGAASTEVEVTTRYRAHLHPRRLWRSLERRLGRRLHRHILSGIAAVVASAPLPVRVVAAGPGGRTNARTGP